MALHARVTSYASAKSVQNMVRVSRHIKKPLALFIILVVLYLSYCFFLDDDNKETYRSEYNYTCKDISTLLRGLDTNICIEKPSIFFVETSSSSILNPRQACAIESTAHHNPSLSIKVLMTSVKSIDLNHLLLKTLKTISTVQFIRINIGDVSHGTPIQNWYHSGQWKRSKWKLSHLSDALRYFLMWKYGGIYLDLDIVALRSLENLKNTAITENWDRVAAGILIFDKGHELMKRCMFDFAENYDYSNFVNNGPGIITRNVKSYCDIQNVGKVSGANCMVDIQSPESAFPIPYDKWQEYFTPTNVNNITNYFNSSYLIHVWNKYSKNSKLWIGSNSLYELAMKEHCPLTYNYAKTIGYI